MEAHEETRRRGAEQERTSLACTSMSPASKYAGARFSTLQLVIDCWSLVSGSHSAAVDWFCGLPPHHPAR